MNKLTIRYWPDADDPEPVEMEMGPVEDIRDLRGAVIADMQDKEWPIVWA